MKRPTKRDLDVASNVLAIVAARSMHRDGEDPRWVIGCYASEERDDHSAAIGFGVAGRKLLDAVNSNRGEHAKLTLEECIEFYNDESATYSRADAAAEVVS